MEEILRFSDVEKSIIELRGQKVILDCDVAALYGVETREINQAVKNNAEKFPKGYILGLNDDEWGNLKSKILISSWGGIRKVPNAFTEKGLYMLATILKSRQATQTTLAIIETFSKIRELSRAVGELTTGPDEFRQKALMQRSGEILSDIFGSDLHTTGTETEIEMNCAFLKIKHKIKREKNVV